MIDPDKLHNLKRYTANFWMEFRAVAVFLVLMIAFRSAVADWSDVPTGSMKPTIIEGDRIFVKKLAYDLRLPLTHISLLRLADPQRGDIIIFDSAVSELRLVKRVIGVPGDVVEVRSDVVYVNGEPLHYSLVEDASDFDGSDFARDMRESIQADNSGDNDLREYTVRMTRGGRLSSYGPVEVPDDSYFVLGDNRDNSADSRVIGFVPRSEIVGRSDSVVLSLDYENSYLPRTERFFHTL
ncbi:MAG: signal peptidase I [Gammaproteobacteria bacterium]|nr:signal peptidase I [Gammaproteobacteria bacterium]MDP2141030.1 signal peptidase I [Gammaproteobacteria bacterium]MDP2348489.1 signal peptidase I [Gammaproteobacteria bacterium]